MLRVVTPNVTGATSKMPNVYAGCYGVTGLAPQEGMHCHWIRRFIEGIRGSVSLSSFGGEGWGEEAL